MVKFSIIIPILNVEQYLPKCLDSVKNQTFRDFECLLICDDSTDKSNIIAKKYVKEDNRFKYYHESNTGLSIARNIGIDKSKGEYLLFLDSDDYFEFNLLEKLNNELQDEDLIRFQVREVFKDHLIDWNEKEYIGNGYQVFCKIINFHYVENAWSYCYSSKYFKSNNFKFMEHCIAEDYGLIPLVIAKAKKIKVLSYIGYNYVQRENSLMNNKNYDKRIKKLDDMLKQAEYLYNSFQKIENKDKFLMFINNSLIYYSTTLKYSDYQKYKKTLNQMHAFDYIETNNFKQKIKKLIIKINPYFFYNYLMRLL